MDQVRVQILLEPRQHKALKQVARQSHKSLSELVREITDAYLAQVDVEQQDDMLLALDQLCQIRERQPVYQSDPVADVRAERQDQIDQGQLP